MENCDIQCLVSRSPSTETWEMWNPIKLNCYWVESVYLVAAAQQSSRAVPQWSWLLDWVGDWRQEVVIPHHILTINHTLVRPRTIQSEVKKSKKLVREALKTVGNTVEQIHFFVFTSIILEGKDWGSQHYMYNSTLQHNALLALVPPSALPLLAIHLRLPIPWSLFLPFCPLLIKLYKVFSSQTGELYLLCFILLELYHCLQAVDICV